MPVALFIDRDADAPGTRTRGGRMGWPILSLALLGITAASLIPAPYVIEQPGPVFDTLGTVEVDGEEVPLIEIPDEQTYPTAGSLDMLTVSIRGSRADLPNWLEVVSAWFDASMAVVPVDSVYPDGVSLEQSNEQSRLDMANSQKDAIAAALRNLGHTIPNSLTVVGTQKDMPAVGSFAHGDVIVGVNGATVEDVAGLRAAIADNGTTRAADIAIVRDGVPRTVSVVPAMSAGTEAIPVIGVVIDNAYEFPFDVKIQLENVGGPSAGMMFALGIIDKLTPGELNGGQNVAGTGTIDSTGDIGPIGGIVQKMYGAEREGADYFLAPAGNCGDVSGRVPDGLTVFAVATLDDSLRALETIASGGDTAELPVCPVQ